MGIRKISKRFRGNVCVIVLFCIAPVACTKGFKNYISLPSSQYYAVTTSGTGVSISPSAAQEVASGATLSLTVTANSGLILSTAVGGTCPNGSWSGAVYTSGAITSDCTITFSASATIYTVTSSGTGVSISPSSAQSVASGAKVSLTVTADSGLTLSTTVGGTCPQGAWSGVVYTSGAITSNCTITFSAEREFTALHTYYMSPTGNDANSGTSPSSPWLTPNNHALSCGDVIIAAAGTYTTSSNLWNISNTVSNCPSTSAGLDGTGGIYFAQVKCETPFACFASSNTAVPAVEVRTSNWAILGFVASANVLNSSCFNANPHSNTVIHHIAFINDICTGAYSGGFQADAHAAGYGVDYWAVVGTIAYDTARGVNLCFSGISNWDPVNSDALPGTHVFVAGNLAYNNVVPLGCANDLDSDGEGLIFDDWGGAQIGQAAYTGQGVAEQNLFIGNSGDGISIGGGGNPSAPIILFNNTTWGNTTSTNTRYGQAELFLGAVSATTNIFNNIFHSTSYSYIVTGVNGNGSTGHNHGVECYACGSNVSIANNYIYNDLNTSGYQYNNTPSGFTYGLNTNANPNFAAPAIPSGPPDCTGFSNIVSCMATTFAKFVPSGGAATLGYQPPGSCKPDSYFPTWLKGVIPAGIITMPCGM